MRNYLLRIIPTFLVALAVTTALAAFMHWPDQQPSRVSSSPIATDSARQKPIPANPGIRKVGNIPSIGETYFRDVHIEFISKRLGWLYAGRNLWRTEDGGENWLLIYDASPNYTARGMK